MPAGPGLGVSRSHGPKPAPGREPPLRPAPAPTQRRQAPACPPQQPPPSSHCPARGWPRQPEQPGLRWPPAPPARPPLPQAARQTRTGGTPPPQGGGRAGRCHTGGMRPAQPSTRGQPGSRGIQGPAGLPGHPAATGYARGQDLPAGCHSDSRASGFHSSALPGALTPARRGPSGTRQCRALAGSG
jgi:hypothetical protein